jgi:hypothetical protein
MSSNQDPAWIFPLYDLRLQRRPQGLYVWDIIRKQYVSLQPEEWVRQQTLQYLIQGLGYPQGWVQVERGLRYGIKRLRTDVVLYHPQTTQPWVLIECKAPEIPLSESTLHQALTYQAKLQAQVICLTNGLRWLTAIQNDSGKWVFEEAMLPPYAQMMS